MLKLRYRLWHLKASGTASVTHLQRWRHCSNSSIATYCLMPTTNINATDLIVEQLASR